MGGSDGKWLKMYDEKNRIDVFRHQNYELTLMQYNGVLNRWWWGLLKIGIVVKFIGMKWWEMVKHIWWKKSCIDVLRHQNYKLVLMQYNGV